MDVEDVTEALRLLRYVHVEYLQQGIGTLPAMFASLDASRPWLVYWIVHSLALLEARLPDAGPHAADIISFLRQCQCPGGWGRALKSLRLSSRARVSPHWRSLAAWGAAEGSHAWYSTRAVLGQ